MKKLLTTVALLALVATPALAQTRDPQTRDRAPTRDLKVHRHLSRQPTRLRRCTGTPL